MTDYNVEYDPFAEEDEELEAKKKPRKIPLPRCIHCPDREVTSDGKSGWVHNDDLRYSCDPAKPGPPFADAALATGGVIHERIAFRAGAA